MNPARRTDWKVIEMPATRAHLNVERVFAPEDFARLTFGVIPRSMEEKWFVFFESPWLYLHRSWSGECIYQIRFEQCPGGVGIAEAIARREVGGTGEHSAGGAAGRLMYLLESIVQRNHRYGNVRVFPGAPGPSA
jgi:hypothetical protein